MSCSPVWRGRKPWLQANVAVLTTRTMHRLWQVSYRVHWVLYRDAAFVYLGVCFLSGMPQNTGAGKQDSTSGCVVFYTVPAPCILLLVGSAGRCLCTLQVTITYGYSDCSNLQLAARTSIASRGVNFLPSWNPTVAPQQRCTDLDVYERLVLSKGTALFINAVGPRIIVLPSEFTHLSDTASSTWLGS